MRALVIAEHSGTQLNEQFARVVTAAQHWQHPVDVLIVADQPEPLAQAAAEFEGVSTVLVATDSALKHPTAEQLTNIVLALSSEYQVILAAHSAYSKNYLPRVAALLDVNMASDVLSLETDQTYVRGIYAGNVLATIQSLDSTQVLTVRANKFTPAAQHSHAAAIQTVSLPTFKNNSRWVSESRNQSVRPPLATAKIVVSGGRSLGSAAQFEAILTPLADKLNAAIGASRAAVDAGYAPNDLQVGQTGVVVAPELYIAVGISGAIQHTYGMKDSRLVVAINQDPDAPIFKVADIGLVADLFEAIPQLTAAV